MMSEYDDLLADADEVIEHLGEVVERLRTRIAELEKLDAERLEQILGKNEVIDNLRAEYESRIAELQAKLATSEELAEQHLREIDSLELQFRHLRP